MKAFYSLFMAAILTAAMGLYAQEAAPEVAPEEEAPAAVETEEEKDWSVSLGLQYSSHNFDKGAYSNAEPIFTGDIQVSWKGLFAGVTGIYDTTDYNDHEREFEEYDWTFGYEGSIAMFDYTLSYIHYSYPSAREDESNELSLAVNAQCLLNPGFEVYYDFEDSLVYGNLNIGHDFELCDQLTWTTGAQLWWGNKRFQLRDFDLYRNEAISAVVETSLDFSVNDYITFGPFASFGWALGHEMRNTWKEDPDMSAFNWTVGLALSVEI